MGALLFLLGLALGALIEHLVMVWLSSRGVCGSCGGCGRLHTIGPDGRTDMPCPSCYGRNIRVS